MPHVDEGTLHALLDGALRAESPDQADRVEAHLAGCADCRARLEAAGDVRDRASEILSAAGPVDGPMAASEPDFGEVMARARAGAAAPNGAPAGGVRTGDETGDGAESGGRAAGGLTRQLTWTRRLGWAASVVLALGTGYLIRDLAAPGGPGGPTAASETAETSVPLEASAPSQTATAAETPTETPPETPPRTRTAAGTDSPVPPNAASDVPAESQEPAAELAVASTAFEEETSAVADRAEPPRSKAVLEATAADVAAARPMTAESAAVAPLPVAALSPAADSVVAVEPPALMEYARGERPLPADWRETGALVAQAQRLLPTPDRRRWTAVTTAEADGTSTGPVYVLPGAELLETYVDRDGVQVMTLQRLQTGIPVRVIQSRGGAGAGAGVLGIEGEPEADGGRGARGAPSLPDIESVRVVRGEFVLELSGALPAALLEVLGETAEPAGEEPRGQ